MPDSRTLVFESYRLDLGREQLRRDEDAIQLTNKAFAVLRYFVEHAEQLVTRDALLEAVWPGTFVSDAVLTVCIHELRQALGETAQAPRFIETVRGRGYRFLAPVTSPISASIQDGVGPPVALVGREAELRQLQQGFVTALQGERQVVFMTGEAGIGKTTLVEAFLAQIARDETAWIGYGQCIDQYGAGEAYLPLLEALGRLCRGSEGSAMVELLRQEAPSWLLQMPALLSADEFDSLQRRGGGATRERMLRELAEALERLTAERPFVLVLEDLHWSDSATLDWLSYVARRRDRARLLILGTYRPVETIVQAHPLRTVTQELKRHSRCWELLLDYLSEAGVAAYVKQRFGSSDLPAIFPQVLHQQTNGNPLFMMTLVEDMIQRGVLLEGPQGWSLREALDIVAMEVPESLRQLIEDQLEHLSPEEQDILEAASVTGLDFSTAALAAGVDATEEDVERCCAALCRRKQFLQEQGQSEWSDGTVAARYGFIHALYQEVLYNRVPAGRRGRLHGRIGARLEVGYGAQAREIAAELAIHFIRGRDAQRASQYLWEAGDNALRRSAYQEAITHLMQGLEVLASLPENAERIQHELRLHTALGPALMAIKGYAAPEVEHCYHQARALCQQIGAAPQIFPVLNGLRSYYFLRAEYETACELADQLLVIAQREGEPTLLGQAYLALGINVGWLGEFNAAAAYLEQSLETPEPQPSPASAFSYRRAPRIAGLSFSALTLWHLGYPDRALHRIEASCACAEELEHPFSRAYALGWALRVHQYRREVHATQQIAEVVIDRASAHDFPHWWAGARVARGWTWVELGEHTAGLADIRRGMSDYHALGAEVARTWCLCLLTESCRKAGRSQEAWAALIEALARVTTTGERTWEAELYRLKGELLLTDSAVPQTEVEACFGQALDIARRQQAKSLELRSALSLSRLWQQQGRHVEAHGLLAPVYGWFTEGLNTADLQEARAHLEMLMPLTP